MHLWYDMVQIMRIWIDENIEDNPQLFELAERLGYSYFYVTKKFHEIEGVSFREYVSNRKIRRAAADLYMTTKRMVDIAIRYEYSSLEAFTRSL